MLIWNSIKNLFAPKCGSCRHHSGGEICNKLKGIVSKSNPTCEHFKLRLKKKKRKKRK